MLGGVKEEYALWELRILIIASMFFQIVVFCWRYRRQKSSSKPLRKLLWLIAYLAADYFAARSLGNILKSNLKPADDKCRLRPPNKYLLALWAPFILLHLGGHSTVTAFTLEDNEFWLRHLITFFFHEMTAIFICMQSFTRRKLQLPFLFILFIIGTIKFGERVWVLRCGSMNGLRRSVVKKSGSVPVPRDGGGNNEHVRRGKPMPKTMPDENEDLERGQPAAEPQNQCDMMVNIQPRSRDERVISICRAYRSFQKYKGLYIDNVCASGERDNGFGNVNEAIRLMEMELSFAYDWFYSKSSISDNVRGWVFRGASLILILIAGGLFFSVDKDGFSDTDVGITSCLLILAVVLEILSLIDSAASSRTLVLVGCTDIEVCRWLEGFLVEINKLITKICRCSIKVGQYSLLSYCFRDTKSWGWLKGLLDYFEVEEYWNSFRYVQYVPLNDELKTKIFEVITTLEQTRPSLASLTEGILSQMGGNSPRITSSDMGFEKFLLTWHIATDLYHHEFGNSCPNLQRAKILSDYMLYLLFEHPALLSAEVTVEQKNYREARDEALNRFKAGGLAAENYDGALRSLENFYREESVPSNDFGTLSLLSRGVVLARELKLLGVGSYHRPCPEGSICELMLQLWVAILSYAAVQSKGKYHAQQLGTGGEFFTFVWLYMVHLGIV